MQQLCVHFAFVWRLRQSIRFVLFVLLHKFITQLRVPRFNIVAGSLLFFFFSLFVILLRFVSLFRKHVIVWERIRFCCRKISNNIFNTCSHIQKNTQNPNTIFKLTIYCTKDTQTPQIRLKQPDLFENSKNINNSKTFKT